MIPGGARVAGRVPVLWGIQARSSLSPAPPISSLLLVPVVGAGGAGTAQSPLLAPARSTLWAECGCGGLGAGHRTRTGGESLEWHLLRASRRGVPASVGADWGKVGCNWVGGLRV